jgi:subtilisin family serine protease
MDALPDDACLDACEENRTRVGQYMIASRGRAATAPEMIERLSSLGVTDVVRSFEPDSLRLLPIAVVRASGEKIAAARAAGGLTIEKDLPLKAASAPAGSEYPLWLAAAAARRPFGSGLSATFHILAEEERPVEGAVVGLIGDYGVAEGVTDATGRVTLSLRGSGARASALYVRPLADYWSLYRTDPRLDPGAATRIALRRLTPRDPFGWGGRAMGFDRLPSDLRGRSAKIALIDSGVATSHPQLGAVKRGFDASHGEERSWSEDWAGHGTLCAGILVADPEGGMGFRGLAPDAELFVCKLAADAVCSDLVGALNACAAEGVDVACIGFGCERGSTIVEQCLEAAKRRGVATIAAAGSDGGPTRFPARAPHVLAVGAIGRMGVFPEDSLEAKLAEAARAGRSVVMNGFFLPAFASAGPGIDLCAPGVAVVSCQSPEGVAACDGASVAAPHVAALAALIVAHRADFRSDFANRDASRVDRLFRILMETATPLGDPMRTGAGLPDAPRAIGLGRREQPAEAAQGLGELRYAMQLAGLAEVGFRAEPDHSRMAGSPAAASTDFGALREAMLLAGLSGGH